MTSWCSLTVGGSEPGAEGRRSAGCGRTDATPNGNPIPLLRARELRAGDGPAGCGILLDPRRVRGVHVHRGESIGISSRDEKDARIAASGAVARSLHHAEARHRQGGFEV